MCKKNGWSFFKNQDDCEKTPVFNDHLILMGFDVLKK
ncbi:MAG: hypothetical protein UW09_C0003G0093 [candidate division TM6 bacterium GW2011_GWF2_43_87]|nr:MAG: hypothetical protein UW09_C0003G0093 [candidate division TM6 bacterium GW2011_GWF2_43_87]